MNNTNTTPSFVRPASHSYPARYGLLRTVTKVAPLTYIINGKSAYMRGAEGMIDFEGGPCIAVGMHLKTDHIIHDAPDWVGADEVVSDIESIGANEGREACGLVPVPNDSDAWVRITTTNRSVYFEK